jgi:sortase A
MPRRSWIEISMWTVGLALLMSYGAVRLWLEHARAEGVRLASQSSAVSRSGATLTSVTPGALGQIDQTLWSDQRRQAFAPAAAAPGVPVGVMRIASVRLEVPVYDELTELNLNRGAARIADTADLLEAGNTGIAGHRDGFFRKLKDVQLGDDVQISARGRTAHFRVSEIRIVSPKDVHVLEPTSVPSVTLVTCYPFYLVGHAPLRYIVRAERVTANKL